MYMGLNGSHRIAVIFFLFLDLFGWEKGGNGSKAVRTVLIKGSFFLLNIGGIQKRREMSKDILSKNTPHQPPLSRNLKHNEA
jgi:hypothetical protein